MCLPLAEIAPLLVRITAAAVLAAATAGGLAVTPAQQPPLLGLHFVNAQHQFCLQSATRLLIRPSA